MEPVSCHFCNKTSHVSEYCREYPTLRSRYAIVIKKKQSNCLCPNFYSISYESQVCRCRKICEACFQHHHIAMCPKRDPEHPSNPILIPERLQLFSHPSHFAARFFDLGNPIEQYKLQKTCKFFQSLKSMDLKLKPIYYSDKPVPRSKNIVLNKSGCFYNKNNLKADAEESKCHFNLDNILVENSFITKADLQFLAKNDPHFVVLSACTFDHCIEFQDIINAFPYASRFYFYRQINVPNSFISNFLCSIRKVEFKEIIIETECYLDFDVDHLVQLFEQNKYLSMKIFADRIPSDGSIELLQTHPRFWERTQNHPFNLQVNFETSMVKLYFQFNEGSPFDDSLKEFSEYFCFD